MLAAVPAPSERGLTKAEALRRLPERAAPARRGASRSYGSIVRANVLTLFNLILAAFGTVTLCTATGATPSSSGSWGGFTAAEMVSIAAFIEDRHAQAFPSFGSQRTGAPVVAFCRIDDSEIRMREPIAEPDALIVQDPTLLHRGAPGGPPAVRGRRRRSAAPSVGWKRRRFHDSGPRCGRTRPRRPCVRGGSCRPPGRRSSRRAGLPPKSSSSWTIAP